MKLQESGENYLENIYILMKRNGSVRSVDIAREMEFSKPSVSRAVHLLKDLGYLLIQDDGLLELTEKGLSKATLIYERHLFLSGYLMALGVSEEVATADACRIEHVISTESFDKLKEHVDYCMNDCPARGSEEGLLAFNRNIIKQLEVVQEDQKA